MARWHTAVFFYLFAILAVASAAMVIVAKNPVHAVLFLILTFFNAAGLFVLLNAEFLAMLLVIVYVGAVAVLFLFVVMMLDVDFAELRAGFIKNAPIGVIVGGVVLAELIALFVARGAGHVTVESQRFGGSRKHLQYGSAGADPLYEVRLLLPGGGAHSAGRHDRRHRADAAAQGAREASVDRGAGGAAAGNGA